MTVTSINKPVPELLISLIYESAYDPAAWQLYLEEFEKVFGVGFVNLVIWPEGKDPQVLDLWNGGPTNPDLWRQYEEHFVDVDLFLPKGLDAEPGLVHSTMPEVTPEEFLSSELYADWMVPMGLGESVGEALFCRLEPPGTEFKKTTAKQESFGSL